MFTGFLGTNNGLSCFIQNSALNLAAIAGNASIVTYLLSVKDQEILMNSYNQNVLDLAVKATKEDVAMAIADHDRHVNPLNCRQLAFNSWDLFSR